jgi:hypothetical protein
LLVFQQKFAMEECIDGNVVSRTDGNLYWSHTVDAMDGVHVEREGRTEGREASHHYQRDYEKMRAQNSDCYL